MRTRLQPAFTLVEVMVVIAVITVLIALLLPAVQSARESARRTQCANNLKQIGLALHMYEQTYRCFPPGSSGRIKQNLGTGGAEVGSLVYILPFLEQRPVFNQIELTPDNFDLNWFYLQNPAMLETQIATYICPSGHWAPSDHKPITHYLPSAGTSWNVSAQKTDGVFFEESAIKHAHIRDGASNTVAFSEHTWSDSPLAPVNPLYDLYQMEPHDAARNPADLEAWCSTVDPNSAEAKRGVQDRVNWYNVKYYNHTRAPNMATCRNYRDTNRFGNMRGGLYPFELMPPTSEHPGGVNMLFCDGGVRFIFATIDPSSFAAMGTRNGDDIVRWSE